MVSSTKHVPIVKKHKKVGSYLDIRWSYMLMNIRRHGSAINPTDSSAFLQHGESQRASTTEYEDGLRARWSCHRYVRTSESEWDRRERAH